jgi:hypothetical protein
MSPVSLWVTGAQRNGTKESVQTVMRQQVLCGGKSRIQQSRKDPRSLGQWLALAKKLVLGEWLAEIILPRRQIGVGVRFDIPSPSSVTMPNESSTATLTG